MARGVVLEAGRLFLDGRSGRAQIDLGEWRLRNQPPGDLVAIEHGTDVLVVDRAGAQVGGAQVPPGRTAIATERGLVVVPTAEHEPQVPHDLTFLSLHGDLVRHVVEPSLRMVSGGSEADGRLVTVNLGPGAGERTVIVYGPSGEVRWRYTFRDDGIPTVAVTPDDRRLVVLTHDARGRTAHLVFLVRPGRVRAELQLPNVYALAIDARSRRLAAVGQNVAALVDVRSGKLTWRRDEPIDLVLPGGLRLDAATRQLQVVSARRDRSAGTGAVVARRFRWRDGAGVESLLGTHRLAELAGVQDVDLPATGRARVVLDDGRELSAPQTRVAPRDIPPEEYPGQVVAVPFYGPFVHPDSYDILVSWAPLDAAVRYEVYRATDGGPLVKIIDLDQSRSSYDDDDVALGPGHTYQYTVVGCLADRCLAAGSFATSVETKWPISGGREILHGFNEITPWNADTGFHRGTDLNRVTPGAKADDLLAPRGGVVDRILVPANHPIDDDAIFITVETSDGTVFDVFNHLSTAAGDTSVAAGDPVAPGQKVGVMGSRHFYGPLTDHVHMNVWTKPDYVDVYDPLRIFPDPADRDPHGTPPALIDENGDGTTFLWIDAGEPTQLLDYDHDTKPLSGDVDLVVEVADEQGTNPRVAPTVLGYWIEGPHGALQGVDDVKSARAPYMLIDFRTYYYGDWVDAEHGQLCAGIASLFPRTNLGCQNIPHGCLGPPISAADPCAPTILKTDDGGDWHWPLFHHFVVTHASRIDGYPDGIDPRQHWRTFAKQDDAPADADDANYAGKDTTPRGMDARFPDGDYTIHVVASDLVHQKVELPIHGVRVENFAPFVEKIVVVADLDGDPDTSFNDSVPGCEVPVYGYAYLGHGGPYPGPDLATAQLLAPSGLPLFARADRKLCVAIKFSESMAPITVALVRPAGADIAVRGALEESRNPNDFWTGSVVLPEDPTGGSDSSPTNPAKDAILRITAHDLPDRFGAERTLDVDGSGTPGGPNENHRIKIDLSAPKTSVKAERQP